MIKDGVKVVLCAEHIGRIVHIPSTEQDGVFNVMSMDDYMRKNGSSLAWMTTTYWISTIAKIPSTEQDGVFNVMCMGQNGSSLAWMTTIWPG